MGGVGALVGLAGPAVVVLSVAVILADDPAHQVVILLLVGAFHALQIGHIGAPGIQTGAGAVHAGLGVVPRAGRPHCIDDAAVAGQHLVLDLRDCPADGAAGRGRDLIHGGVHQRVGRRAVFLVVFQIGVDGHRLRFPRLLCRRVTDIAADGAQLGVGDAHQTVLKIQGHVPAQALPLDVQVGHGDGIAGAEEPAQAVFLLVRDQSSVGTAHGGGTGGQGVPFRCKGGRHCHAEQHHRQHQRRTPARKLRHPFQVPCPPAFCILFSLAQCRAAGKDLNQENAAGQSQKLHPAAFHCFYLMLPVSGSPRAVQCGRSAYPFRRPSRHPQPGRRGSGAPPSHGAWRCG